MPTNLKNKKLLESILISETIVFDADALTIIDSMPDPLASNELVGINTFVVKEKSVGNWTTYDEIQCYKMVTESNALTGWLGNASATNSGATKVAKGFKFGATPSRLLSGFNVLNNSVNFQHTECFVSMYIEEYPNSEIGFIYGQDGDGGNDVLLRQGLTRLQSNTGNYNHTLTFPSLYTTSRNGNDVILYKDGVNAAIVGSGGGTGLANQEIHIGGSNRSGSPILSAEGAVATFWSIGGILADHAAHSANVRELLNTLGA